MLPASEFSMGIKPRSQVFPATALNTSSNDSHGTVSTCSELKCALIAASEKAPGSPWKAMRISSPLRSHGFCPAIVPIFRGFVGQITAGSGVAQPPRSEEHTSELQSPDH